VQLDRTIPAGQAGDRVTPRKSVVADQREELPGPVLELRLGFEEHPEDRLAEPLDRGDRDPSPPERLAAEVDVQVLRGPG